MSTLKQDITALLDDDCDETRVALYNPRATVAAIRVRLEQPEPEPTVDDAFRILNRDYWDDVRGVVDEMKRAIRDHEVTSEEELYDYLCEHTEGHQRVIYTFQARWGLCCSDNPDAYEEETGEKPASVEAQMLVAFQADIRARLSSYDELCEELEEERQEAEQS